MTLALNLQICSDPHDQKHLTAGIAEIAEGTRPKQFTLRAVLF